MTGNDDEQLQAMGQQQRAITVGDIVRYIGNVPRLNGLKGAVTALHEWDDMQEATVVIGGMPYIMDVKTLTADTPEPDALAAANDERREKMWAALDTIIARGDRIEALEKAIARIEQLEAALKEIDDRALQILEGDRVVSAIDCRMKAIAIRRIVDKALESDQS